MKPEQPIHENLADIEEPAKTEAGLEIARTSELEKIVERVNDLAGKIERDENVSAQEVLDLDSALNRMKIDFYGDQLTMDEIRQIPDRQQNTKLFQKIMSHEYLTVERMSFFLTYLPVGLAKILSEHGGIVEIDGKCKLNLHSLKSLSFESAKELVRLRQNLETGVENLLLLDGLTAIPADIAQLFEGVYHFNLSIQGLTELSDEAAKSLSKFEGKIYCPDKFKKQIAKFKN